MGLSVWMKMYPFWKDTIITFSNTWYPWKFTVRYTYSFLSSSGFRSAEGT